MKNSKAAILSVMASGALWGVISFFIRALDAGGLNSLQISFVRMFVSAVVFSLFVLIKDKSKFKIKLRDLWMFAGTGIVSIVVFNGLYFYTMINSQASVAVVLLYTSPVFIMILSAFLFKEKITVRKIIALVLTVIGCACATGLVGSGYKIKPFVLLLGLGSGLFYALYTIFGRVALEKYDTLTVTVYSFIFGLTGSLFVGKPIETTKVLIQNPSLIIWGIGVGIVCTVMPYFLYTYGLQRIESGKAAIIVAVEPVVATVIGILCYGDDCSVVKISGIVFILASIVLLNLKSKNEKSK